MHHLPRGRLPAAANAAGGRPRPRAVALAAAIGLLAAACAGATSDVDQSASADAAPADAVAPDTGQVLPDLQLTAFDGQPTDLHSYVGTPLVINFWASWCPPCAAEMPDFEAVSQQAGDAVTFIGINSSDEADLADDLADRTGVTYDLLRDPEGSLFQAMGGFGMPTTAFVAADGTVVSTHTGFLTRDALAGEIQRWLGVELAS